MALATVRQDGDEFPFDVEDLREDVRAGRVTRDVLVRHAPWTGEDFTPVGSIAALAEVGLDIRHATVQTVGMEVVDTFYVQTATGEQVTDRFHRGEIERALLHVVG